MTMETDTLSYFKDYILLSLQFYNVICCTSGTNTVSLGQEPLWQESAGNMGPHS